MCELHTVKRRKEFGDLSEIFLEKDRSDQTVGMGSDIVKFQIKVQSNLVLQENITVLNRNLSILNIIGSR